MGAEHLGGVEALCAHAAGAVLTTPAASIGEGRDSILAAVLMLDYAVPRFASDKQHRRWAPRFESDGRRQGHDASRRRRDRRRGREAPPACRRDDEGVTRSGCGASTSTGRHLRRDQRIPAADRFPGLVAAADAETEGMIDRRRLDLLRATPASPSSARQGLRLRHAARQARRRGPRRGVLDVFRSRCRGKHDSGRHRDPRRHEPLQRRRPRRLHGPLRRAVRRQSRALSRRRAAAATWSIRSAVIEAQDAAAALTPPPSCSLFVRTPRGPRGRHEGSPHWPTEPAAPTCRSMAAACRPGSASG